jgi:hypothetical protein
MLNACVSFPSSFYFFSTGGQQQRGERPSNTDASIGTQIISYI